MENSTEPRIDADKRPLLDAQNITVTFDIGKSHETLFAVHNSSLSINRGEIHGLVGESGSGKSTLARVICGLQPTVSGNVVFNGTVLGKHRTKKEKQAIQMVFQDPFASLDPRMTVRATIAEILRCHHIVERKDIDNRCRELMELVQLSPSFLNAHPNDMSGGQRQRVVIARALAVNPQLLIADEAVASLDVSVQAGIINLLIDLRDKYHVSILFIAHNLAVVRSICDRISVMYLGRIVEEASRDELYSNPVHPYTRKLLNAVPSIGGLAEKPNQNPSNPTITLPNGKQAIPETPNPTSPADTWIMQSLDSSHNHYVAATISQ